MSDVRLTHRTGNIPRGIFIPYITPWKKKIKERERKSGWVKERRGEDEMKQPEKPCAASPVRPF